ncbi:MAG: hypothetical protein ACOX25_03515 [Caldicoprobacterales bacterium]
MIDPVEGTIEVDVDGKALYLRKDLSEVELPDGFELRSLTFGGEEVEAGINPRNKLSLVYLTDEEGKNGAFYIYDSASGKVYNHASIETSLSYVLLQPDDSVEIPQGYEETQVTIDGKTIKAWVLESESEEETGFYLVYAMDHEGNRSFYTYDSMEGTLQRFTDRVVVIEVESEPEPVQEADDTTDLSEEEPTEPGLFQRLLDGWVIKAVIIGLALLFVLLAALLIIDNRKRKSSKH